MSADENTGAAKYRAKKRRAWVIFGAATAASAALGYVIGAYVGYAESMDAPVHSYISAPIAWALAALFMALFWGVTAFAWKTADEVEMQESHVASSIALYFYLSVFMAWEALYRLGAAPAVDGLRLFGATCAVMLIVLLLRRYWPR